MNTLYNHGIKQTQLIQKDLLSLEKNVSTSPLSLQGSITTSLTSFKKTIKEYRELIDQNGGDDKHQGRLNKFENDLVDLSKKFESLRAQREAAIHEQNREDLLGRRHNASSNPYEQQGSGSQELQQEQERLSYSEGLYNERSSLARGTQQLDHILEMGQQAFEDLVDQNEILQKLQGKFEESLITLGVSQGTIRSIERRAKQDKWLFWGGLILMLVIFYYITKLFR